MGMPDEDEMGMVGMCIDDKSNSEDSDSLASDITMDELPDHFGMEEACVPTVEHILIKKDDLSSFMEKFHCANCRAPVRGVKFKTVGIATKVSYTCHRCKKKEISIEPEVVTTNRNSPKFFDRIASYALNLKLILITHLIGRSHQAALIICSLLGLSASPFRTNWYTIEDNIGVIIQQLVQDIVKENIQQECSGVDVDDDGYTPVDVSGDGGWQSGGRSYDSISGHTLLIGKRTNKVLAFEHFSKSCMQCSIAQKKGIEPKQHHCPKNYTGSSKGMECTGLLNCILKLHNGHNIKIRKFVIDNDATTKAICKHSYRELIRAGRMERADWPRSASGITEKKDQGKLPLTHPPILFVADLNHKVRSFGKALWNLASSGRSKTECTKVDCQRLKRNFSYFL